MLHARNTQVEYCADQRPENKIKMKVY